MKESKIADLIVEQVPKQLLMAIIDAVYVGSIRAYDASKKKSQGHRATHVQDLEQQPIEIDIKMASIVI